MPSMSSLPGFLLARLPAPFPASSPSSSPFHASSLLKRAHGPFKAHGPWPLEGGHGLWPCLVDHCTACGTSRLGPKGPSPNEPRRPSVKRRRAPKTGSKSSTRRTLKQRERAVERSAGDGEGEKKYPTARAPPFGASHAENRAPPHPPPSRAASRAELRSVWCHALYRGLSRPAEMRGRDGELLHAH